jgi:hypothetical protein
MTECLDAVQFQVGERGTTAENFLWTALSGVLRVAIYSYASGNAYDCDRRGTLTAENLAGKAQHFSGVRGFSEDHSGASGQMLLDQAKPSDFLNLVFGRTSPNNNYYYQI